MATWKGTNNDLQNTTQKAEDWETQTPSKTGNEPWCSGRVCSSCSTTGTRMEIVLDTNIG